MAFAHPVDSACIDFHGIPIELGYEPFGGDAFASLFAGFSQQAQPSNPLTIELARATAPCCDPVGAEWLPTFCHGLMQGYTCDGVHVLSDGRSRLEVFPRLGRMQGRLFDRDMLELSSGMQHIALSLLLRERGVFDAHAATACSGDRALVVLGDSGAGKTTLLLAFMELGCGFLGDDRLLFRKESEGVELLAYPREFHLTARTVRAFPKLSARLDTQPRIDGKFGVAPLVHWPAQFRRTWRGPLSLLLPHIEDRATTMVRPVNAAEAFGKLLAASAAVAVDGIERREEQLASLSALANSATSFDVALGADLLTESSATAQRILDATQPEETGG